MSFARLRPAARRPTLASASAQQVVLDYAPDGAHAVPPTDLLALAVGAAGVGDADLVDAAAELRHLRRDLRLEAEAVLLERDALEHLAAEDLVADLHVGEVHVGEHVREGGEQAVPDIVPVVEHAHGGAAGEARAEDHVRLAGEDGLDQAWVVVRVVLEVGVLHDHEVPAGGLEARAQRGALAPVARLVDHARDPRLDLVAQDLAGAVARAVVHHDHLEVADRRSEHRVDDALDRVPLVEAGDHDREGGQTGPPAPSGRMPAYRRSPRIPRGVAPREAGQGGRCAPPQAGGGRRAMVPARDAAPGPRLVALPRPALHLPLPRGDLAEGAGRLRGVVPAGARARPRCAARLVLLPGRLPGVADAASGRGRRGWARRACRHRGGRALDGALRLARPRGIAGLDASGPRGLRSGRPGRWPRPARARAPPPRLRRRHALRRGALRA